jgi:hypothetical protein
MPRSRGIVATCWFQKITADSWVAILQFGSNHLERVFIATGAYTLIARPKVTKKLVSTQYAIRNSQRRYWRGPTRTKSEWTLAIAFARKFNTKGEAVATAVLVRVTAIVQLSRGNVVEQMHKIRK